MSGQVDKEIYNTSLSNKLRARERKKERKVGTETEERGRARESEGRGRGREKGGERGGGGGESAREPASPDWPRICYLDKNDLLLLIFPTMKYRHLNTTPCLRVRTEVFKALCMTGKQSID